MTINCGVLSSSLALGALITFFTVPDTMIPLFCCMLLGKAYANTFFANLNSRSFARKKLLSHVSVSVSHTTAAPNENLVTSDNITSITTRQRQTTSSQLTIPPFDDVLVISEQSSVESNP
ncbi:hypothetical protein P691DRAFT_802053 [Macrolepiota fuliginosa MF-IS2]|uniref:DUF6534 domain-containing protein n=1 Tax=Macrolepiota fuliginosa MF-IS2 TaxID=1400762 RepID=A0A9P5XLY4_9AGAR|nr:hypothetical protein P691DRAFT_802053 [Macrolepiota fuliginosa MF-IS2]